jgi:hypothetical protein
LTLYTVIIGVQATLVLTEALNNSVARWWAERPIASATASGVGLLLLAGLVIDKWIQRRDQAQWRQVAGLAARSIGTPINLEQRALLVLLGAASFDHSSTPLFSERTAERVRRIEWPDEEASDLSVAERVVQMASSSEWIEVAYMALTEIKYKLRQEIGVWAATLVQNSRLVVVLDAVARATDDLSEIVDLLSSAHQNGGALNEATTQRLADMWVTRLHRSIELREQVRRLSPGLETWVNPYRALVGIPDRPNRS